MDWDFTENIAFKALYEAFKDSDENSALEFLSSDGASYYLELTQDAAGEGLDLGDNETMEELQEEYEYHQYQHFISNSPWSHRKVLNTLGPDASEVMEKEQVKRGKKIGLLIDESAHTKKGNESVGVSRQYNGQLGKVDNCQVGVYLSLVNGKRATLIEETLYLPKSWTEDKARCDRAGIPEEYRSYKTNKLSALLSIIGVVISQFAPVTL